MSEIAFISNVRQVDFVLDVRIRGEINNAIFWRNLRETMRIFFEYLCAVLHTIINI